jgi:recombination protein RecA
MMKMNKKKNTKKENQEKSSRLEEVLQKIEDRFGEGSIIKMEEKRVQKVSIIPTGSLALDQALGVGGIPLGRVVEIFGQEATGKTTLALHILAEAQQQGKNTAFIDAEHALDLDYARKIGIDVNKLIIAQPGSAEEALQIVETLVRSGTVGAIVVDSVAALAPQAEIEGEMGDQQIGLQARLMSRALRKLSGITSKTKTVIIFLNQTRMKIGIPFGNPETTSGGLALKFYSSVRINLRRRAALKRGEEIVGGRIKAKVVKNKVAPPFKTVEFNIYYNRGISKEDDLIAFGLEKGILSRSGAWYNYGKEKLGQGLEQAGNFLRENPKVAKEIWAKILKEE